MIGPQQASAAGWIAVVALFLILAARLAPKDDIETATEGAEVVLALAMELRESSAETQRPRMTIYSDFACGACRRLDSLIAANPWIEARFEVSHRHNPIIGGQLSRRVAQFSNCVFGDSSQAMDRLPLYSGPQSSQRVTMDSILKAVADSGLRASHERCIESIEGARAVEADAESAQRLGLLSTPGIIVDSLLFRGLPGDLVQRLRVLGGM